jgi:hypothetical protein
MIELADEYQQELLLEKCTGYIKKQLSRENNKFQSSYWSTDLVLTGAQVFLYLYLCHKYTIHLCQFWDDLCLLVIKVDCKEWKGNKHFKLLPQELQTKLSLMKIEMLSYYTTFTHLQAICNKQRNCPNYDMCTYCVDKKMLAEARKTTSEKSE